MRALRTNSVVVNPVEQHSGRTDVTDVTLTAALSPSLRPELFSGADFLLELKWKVSRCRL